MKKAFSILILVCYLQLIVVPVFVYADTKESEMKVIKVDDKKIFADKGIQNGILKNTVFDIKRLLGDEPKYIGMAVVSEISDTSCTLKSFPLSFINIKESDLLVLNLKETSALRTKQSENYWEHPVSGSAPSPSSDIFSDGKILIDPKVKLKSGKLLSKKRYIIKRNEELLYQSFGNFNSVKLSDIESIKVATKNYSLFGALFGAAVSGAAVYLQKGCTSIDTSYYNVGIYNDQMRNIGYVKKMKVTKKDSRMKKKYKTGIVVGSCLIGAFLGSFFKGGWKEIYSTDNNNKKTSISISSPEVTPGTVNITLQMRY
jgi:hypothetical protein